MQTTQRILILGAGGQLGTELTTALVKRHGEANVIAADVRAVQTHARTAILDVLDKDAVARTIADEKIDTIYHLAAILSASGERDPHAAWNINMQGLLHVLDAAVQLKVKQVFWPSSIAAFGPNTPRNATPQYCVMDPTSMYGVTKLAGELLCQYYFNKYGLDVRSLRYPGLISYNTAPGGGTTDYAVHIFYEALQHNRYQCFLSADTALPMMYMPDAVKATLQLMDAPAAQVKVRTSYNLAAISFTPAEIAREIQKHQSGFAITYQPDFRQAIADSWPRSIDDSAARADWGWQPDYDLPRMTADMLHQLAAFKYQAG
jgi:nucleoside-diphosphate-sugar epimerase